MDIDNITEDLFMCGIVGFSGRHQAAPVLLDGLEKLEYRGYDSAGIAVRDGENEVTVVKAKGRLQVLKEKTDFGKAINGSIGIGHTRWATHGEPSEINAHPHVSDDGNVTAVHNGIIENYQELKEKLSRHGYTFYSQTDTEVVTKLIDYYYKKYGMGPVDAIAKTMVRVRGSYALAIMFKDHPGEIWAARKDSPMIIGVDKESSYVASDVPAILKYTRNVYYIDDLEMACIEPGKATFYNLDGDVIEKEQVVIDWDASAAEKDGFEHFMMKEIHEQPRAVADTLKSVVSPEGEKYVTNLSETGLTAEEMKTLSQIYIVACGSAYHVGAAAQYVIEELVHIPVRCELASEFRYRDMPFAAGSLVIIISQSGETADSLAALRKCKDSGIKTLAIVNVIGSTIAREADHVLYTMAGPEISVATTKAYSAQLALSYVLAVELASAKGTIDEEKRQYLDPLIEQLPLPLDMGKNGLADLDPAKLFLCHLPDHIPGIDLDPVDKLNRIITPVYGFHHKAVLIFIQLPGMVINIKANFHSLCLLSHTAGALEIKLYRCSRSRLGKIDAFQIYEAICRRGSTLGNTLYRNLLYQPLIVCSHSIQPVDHVICTVGFVRC